MGGRQRDKPSCVCCDRLLDNLRELCSRLSGCRGNCWLWRYTSHRRRNWLSSARNGTSRRLYPPTIAQIRPRLVCPSTMSLYRTEKKGSTNKININWFVLEWFKSAICHWDRRSQATWIKNPKGKAAAELLKNTANSKCVTHGLSWKLQFDLPLLAVEDAAREISAGWPTPA